MVAGCGILDRVTRDLDDACERFQRCIEDRDVVAVQAILDDDFALVVVQPASATMPRQRWLEVLPDYVVHSSRVSDRVTDVAGELAVVLHRDEMSATVLGQDRSGVFVVTDVWRRRDGEWRIWRRHSTPLTAGRLPGADE